MASTNRTWFAGLVAAGCTGSVDDRTCEDVRADLDAELVSVSTCAQDSDCGQVLAGTSCGCTRDRVARLDADPSAVVALIAEGVDGSCDLGLTSVCDCPEAAGFRCDAGTCAWNYVADWPYLPKCQAADGDGTTITAAAIDGTQLLASITYGGGCEAHDFVLCWPDQAFAESYPVRAGLELYHDGHDDPCDAVLYGDLSFDLQPLIDAYAAAYGPGPASVTVDFGGEALTLVW